MGFHATDQVIVVAIVAGAETRSIVGLEALSETGAEREVGLRIVGRQRNIFQAVERFAWDAWIGEHRPVFLPTIEHDRRPPRSFVGYVVLRSGGSRQCDQDGDE